MKIRPLLLVVSLVANAALAFVVLNRLSPPASSASDGAPDSALAAKAGKSASAKAADPNAVDPATWHSLTQGDLAAIAAKLKAEGFPPSLQRAILGAMVAERFADRHKALAGMIDAEPWWRGNLYGSKSGAAITSTRQQLQREEREMLDQLLGVDSGTSAYAHAQQVRQFGDLPAAKLTELNRITNDYNELMGEVRNAAQGVLLPEDRDKLAFLEKERRTDIEKLLTPDELLEYDLRSSSTARDLGRTLAAFAPTEDEFRAIFKIQQASDAPFGTSIELMTPEQRRARSTAQREIAAKVQAVLSPERFAEYQTKTDPAFLQANMVVTRLQLPPTATTEIVAVQKDITKRADAIRADRTLSPEERTTQLSSLATEAVNRLTPTLGETGLSAYRQGGGYWINALQPAPSAAKKR